MAEATNQRIGDEPRTTTNNPPPEALPSYMGFPIGYPRLAEYIKFYPEANIYRRFDSLNARNLLYLQSEIRALEKKLHEYERKEDEEKRARRRERGTATDAEWVWDDTPLGQEHIDTIHELRGKLKEYNEALIQVTKLYKLKFPDLGDMDQMTDLIWSDDMKEPGNVFAANPDARIWGPEGVGSEDLICLSPRMELDTVSSFVAEHGYLCPGFMQLFGYYKKGKAQVVWHDSSIQKAMFRFASFLAVALPFAAVLVLAVVDSNKAKLGSVVGFNALAAIAMGACTLAKPDTVFLFVAIFTVIQLLVIVGGVRL